MPEKTNPNKIDTGNVVAYIGSADVREITAANWAGVGAEGQRKTVWDKSNKLEVPVTDFSREALAYFDTDDGFVVRPASVK